VSSREGNTNALRHGATSEAQIVPIARAQKRRLLRQIGLAAGDLDGVGRALLDNWARAQGKVELLDRYFAAHGFLDEGGDPQPATRLYFVAVNSARLAVVRLNEHLRASKRDHASVLADYLSAEDDAAAS